MSVRVLTTLLLAMVAVGCSGSNTTPNDGVVLEAGAVRERIPRGINPTMVEWRADGVLVPSQDSLVKTPGYVVDSIFPPEEALRRFQETVVGEAPVSLTGGAGSSDAVLRRYWRLLVQGDTLAMSSLVVNRGEFAYLYYPESHDLVNGVPPNVAWLLLGHQSGRGLTRALRAAEDRSPELIGTTCSTPTMQVGSGRIYGPCAVIAHKRGASSPAAGADTIWLAKTLIERDGVHKLMGLHNEL